MTIYERLAIMTTGPQTITRVQLTNVNLIGDIEMGMRKALEKKFRDKVQKKEHKQVKAKIPSGARVMGGKLMVPDSFTKSGKIRGGKILSSLEPRKGKKLTNGMTIPANKRRGMNKGGFPDLSGDGKVTQKDILMGRGVIKKAKGGRAMPAHKKKKKLTKKRVMKRGGGMMKPKMMGGGNVMKKRMKRGGKVK